MRLGGLYCTKNAVFCAIRVVLLHKFGAFLTDGTGGGGGGGGAVLRRASCPRRIPGRVAAGRGGGEANFLRGAVVVCVSAGLSAGEDISFLN